MSSPFNQQEPNIVHGGAATLSELHFAKALILFSANIAQAGQPAPKPQELFASYWTSEPGWDTELQLKNNLASGSLTVTPVLRLPSALEISLDPVTIASNDSVSVWVNLGLLKHSPDLLSSTRLIRVCGFPFRLCRRAERIREFSREVARRTD